MYRDVLVVDRAAVVERKRARFGLGADTTFGGGAEDEATRVVTLETTVRSAQPALGGQWTMQLANGSTWQTLDPLRRVPQAGMAISVRRAPLGGYRASLAQGRSVLVKRVR